MPDTLSARDLGDWNKRSDRSDQRLACLPGSARVRPTPVEACWPPSLGWMLDGFDIMLYALVSALLRDLSISTAVAGLLGSVTLVASGIGGILFGLIADHYGRRRALIGKRPRLLRLHGGMWIRAVHVAAWAVSLPARPRDGW